MLAEMKEEVLDELNDVKEETMADVSYYFENIFLLNFVY